MTLPLPPHSTAAHKAITAELVRITLTGADRPELANPVLDDRTQTRRKARRRNR